MVQELKPGDNINKSGSDEKDLKNALDYLGLDDKEVEDASFINFKIDQEVTKKITKLTQFSMAFRMSLEGKAYDEEKGGYKQTSKSIAGKRFISKSTGILNAYASESNLLTQKDIETFVIQYADACRKVETELLRDRSISEVHTRVIFKMFKDTLFNIGEIITGSKSNMEAVFGKLDPRDPDNTGQVNF